MEDHQEEKKKKKKVMVAIDQSEYSRYALEWALENLRDSIANNHLLIFTVQPISDYSYLQASAYGATQSLFLCLLFGDQSRFLHE
ncbi:putative rossmann-like alpha/beta/alpha sandwich protein [Helianthus anomalus]